MPTPRRPATVQRARPSTADLVLDEAQPAAECRDTLEPDIVAGQVLLERALAAKPKLRRDAFRPAAIVIVQLPAAEWAPFIEMAWFALDPGVRALEMRERGDLQNAGRKDDARPRRYAMSRTDSRSGRSPEADAFVVRRALARGEGVIAFSQSPKECLTLDLLRVADHHIVVPDPTAADLELVAARLTGSAPTKAFPAELVPLVELGDLWLAIRPRQRADQWLERLRKLVATKAGQHSRPSTGTPTLDGMHGMEKAVAWGRGLAEDLSAYRAGRMGWDALDRGAVLHGPPGTGKTTFARALAATCSVPLIAASYSEWQAARSGHLGDTLAAMRNTFDQAKQAAPCILLLDRLDAFPGPGDLGGRHRDYAAALVDGLLEQLDGAAGRDGVIVVGTTTMLDRIDPAILRAGRLDVSIEVPLPGVHALARILSDRLGSSLDEADLLRIVASRPDATGADAESWARGILRRARRDSGRAVCLADLWAEVRGRRTEVDRPTMDRIAIHEAGHALMSVLGAPGTLKGVTRLSHGPFLGRTTSALSEEPLYLTRAELDVRLQYMLAGRVAEEVYFGQASSGSGGEAESDLARATMLATMAEAQFGLGTDLLWLGPTHAAKLAELFACKPELERRVKARLASAHTFVQQEFAPLLGLIEELARRLLEQETLDGSAVEVFVHAELANVHLKASGQSGVSTKKYLGLPLLSGEDGHQAIPSPSSIGARAT